MSGDFAEQMIKRIFLPILLITCFSLTSKAQTISIGRAEDGSYGRGSTISIPVTLTDTKGLLLPNNSFRLYLSDASGNFSNEQLIGSYNSHYTTFVNGLLPSNLAPGNYMVRVKSTNPVSVSQPSAAFTVADMPGLQASVDAPTQTLSSNPKTFGSCASGRANTRFNLTNTSTTGATVTANIINEFNAADVKQLSFDGASTEQFIANISHYTVTVKASLNGVIATQSFFIVNNTQNTPFSTFGSNTVCLPNGTLKYGVEINSASGIQSNFPGYTYRVNWGDQAIETYTFNQIKAAGGIVQHSYYKSSCGSQVVVGSVRYYNVFGIGMQLMSPFCNEIGTPVSTQAKVVTQPENRFGAPEFACLNTSLTIVNNSIAGENPSATSPECNNNNVVYYWYVDNKLMTPGGVPLTYQLKHTFTTAGLHTIRLESESNSDCQAAPIERPIFIQNPPKPSFSLNGETFCVSSAIKTTNTSVIDATNGAPNSFKWVVKGPSTPVFVNGTSSSSENAEFKFTVPGIYTVALTAGSSCEPVSTEEKTIVVNTSPTITANWQSNICGKGQLLTFSNTQGNPVTTNFEGTFKVEPDTYSWEISGGAYEFREETTGLSKTPSIFFKDYGTYTIKITTKNNCGTASITKTLTFNESPTVSAGTDQSICAGSSVQLQGVLSGPPVASFSWKGGNGTFIPNRNTLNAQYLPTQAEITAGQVALTLSASTNIPAPCDKVEDVMILTIFPPNKITTAANAEICTGTEFSYSAKAVIEGSKINWTAIGSDNASGWSTSGTGDIKDVLINTNPSNTATVTYTIIPEANGCPGESFKLVVKVLPLPGVRATAANAIICTGQRTAIALTPSVSNTKYTWTSTATGTITGNTNQTGAITASSINDLLVNTGNTAGSVTYTITPVNAAGCTSEPVSITINVTAAPVIADAGQDLKLCSETEIKLNGNHPGSGTGKWTLSSTQAGITFDDAGKLDAVAKGLKPGQVYRFKWTIMGPGTCNSSSDEVVINNLSPLANNTISYTGYTVCEGVKVTIQGSQPTGGDASEYLYTWESSADASNWTAINLQNQKSLDVIVTQAVFFRRTVKSGSCTQTSTIVKVDVQKGISNNSVSSDQHICLGTTPAKLIGSLPQGADGSYRYQWQQSADGNNWAIITGATEATFQPVTLTQSTYYRRVVSSVLCNGSQQNISNSIFVKVSKGAKANYNWISEAACAPFNITKENIKAEISDSGDSYEWFVNDKSIGKSFDFPGYTLENAGDIVTIKLEVTSALGCGKTAFSHTFKTNSATNAAFTTSITKGCGTVPVSFSNKTQNIEGVDFEWNFGNGQISYQQHPGTITYQARADNKDTTFVIILKAKSKCAVSMDTAYVTIYGKPAPRFSPSAVEGCSPLKITFKNSSPSASSTYIWDFGDGSAKETYTDNRSPQHTFMTGKTKTFTVTMTQRNACGAEQSLSHNIKVAPNTVQPDLVVEAHQLAGCAPHTVKFYNYTTGAQSYTYIFEDGSDTIRTNSDEPIEHTFLKGGVYKVKLIASNCSDTTVIKTITVYHQAEAKFEADVTEGCAPLTVKFNNQTKNAIQQIWDFGNGKTYTGANPPAQVYNADKLSYTVKLITKSNYGCMDTLVMKDYIKVVAPAVADFDVLPGDVIQYPDYRFSFKNKTKGEYTSLSWDFGDDSTPSKANDPEHIYPDTGTYKVKLTIGNSLGCSDVKERIVRITGTPGSLFVPNAFMPNSASEELRAFRAKGSGIDRWEFRIFNKWGETVWKTNKLDAKGAPLDAWDGNFNGHPVPQGVYFWEITAMFKNGNEWKGMSYNNQEPKKTGVIHLIR